MNTNQKDSQFGENPIDDRKKEILRNPDNAEIQKSGLQAADNDDDFLSGNNAPKAVTRDDNNPNFTRPTSLSPGKNPNIGGDESEYEAATSDADAYEEESLADNTDGFANRRDNEEIHKHDDETRYNSPGSRTTSEE